MRSRLWGAIFSRGVAVTGALLALIGSYVFGVIEDVRKNKLAFVDAQIEKLYGPLYAQTEANNAVWSRFVEDHWPNRGFYWTDQQPPTLEQARLWRLWMRTVFQPLNVAMSKVIIDNTHLIVGDTIPVPMLDLIAHAEAYKAVMAGWRDEDFKTCPSGPGQQVTLANCPALVALRNTAGINYPNAVIACVRVEYQRLKQRQQEFRGNSAFTIFFAQPLQRAAECGRLSTPRL